MKTAAFLIFLFPFALKAQTIIPAFENDTSFRYAHPQVLKRIHLKEPNPKKSLLQVRIWVQSHKFPEEFPLQILVLDFRNKNKVFTKHYLVGYRNIHDALKYYLVQKKKTNNDTSLLNKLIKNHILEIPDQKTVLTGRKTLPKYIKVSLTYTIELISRNNKRSYSYFCPKKYSQLYPEIKEFEKVVKILETILEILGDKKTKICFLTLPNEFQRSFTAKSYPQTPFRNISSFRY